MDTLHHLYSHVDKSTQWNARAGAESARGSKQGGARKRVVVVTPLDPSCSNQVTACPSVTSSCGGGYTLVVRGILALKHLCHSTSQDRSQQKRHSRHAIANAGYRSVEARSVPHGGEYLSLERATNSAKHACHDCTLAPVPRACILPLALPNPMHVFKTHVCLVPPALCDVVRRAGTTRPQPGVEEQCPC